jgi:hypothetical protein
MNTRTTPPTWALWLSVACLWAYVAIGGVATCRHGPPDQAPPAVDQDEPLSILGPTPWHDPSPLVVAYEHRITARKPEPKPNTVPPALSNTKHRCHLLKIWPSTEAVAHFSVGTASGDCTTWALNGGEPVQPGGLALDWHLNLWEGATDTAQVWLVPTDPSVADESLSAMVPCPTHP